MMSVGEPHELDIGLELILNLPTAADFSKVRVDPDRNERLGCDGRTSAIFDFIPLVEG